MASGRGGGPYTDSPMAATPGTARGGLHPDDHPQSLVRHQGDEATRCYVRVFPNSGIKGLHHYGEAGPREAGTVLTAVFVLDGRKDTAINGGPEFPFDEAVSPLINCADQDAIDHYGEKLSEGGQEVPCGRLKDESDCFGRSRPPGWPTC
ncbi:VOC family protein [Streptomyces sp. NPDC101393]|uniref:VOC family protein n=1 Tax=Streptomyces sp. NPDC101393 TaxID=3366141 RepID=UPI003810A0AE